TEPTSNVLISHHDVARESSFWNHHVHNARVAAAMFGLRRTASVPVTCGRPSSLCLCKRKQRPAVSCPYRARYPSLLIQWSSPVSSRPGSLDLYRQHPYPPRDQRSYLSSRISYLVR